RNATLPSKTVSVSGPAQSKFEPGFLLLPLHASIHSTKWPGDRSSFLGGAPYSRARDSGINFHDIRLLRIFPLSQMSSAPVGPISRPSSSSAGRGGRNPPSYQTSFTGG